MSIIKQFEFLSSEPFVRENNHDCRAWESDPKHHKIGEIGFDFSRKNFTDVRIVIDGRDIMQKSSRLNPSNTPRQKMSRPRQKSKKSQPSMIKYRSFEWNSE